MAFNEQIHASTRPNIFELFAQESMDGALRPAIQHVCKVRQIQVRCVRDAGEHEELRVVFPVWIPGDLVCVTAT